MPTKAHGSPKLYTRGGDRGDTGLTGGRRVSKGGARVEAYGALDELSSVLGLACAELPAGAKEAGPILERLQHELFILGAELATPEGGHPPPHRIEERHVERLEEDTDRFSSPLEPLHSFVLPRGGVAAARLHVARTVARRAERAIVRLHEEEPVRPVVLSYINRLSGLLFALALAANQAEGRKETPPDYTR